MSFVRIAMAKSIQTRASIIGTHNYHLFKKRYYGCLKASFDIFKTLFLKMTHAELAHKYDFGPGRECVHWEARRKQRTIDKRDEAMQELNVKTVVISD